MEDELNFPEIIKQQLYTYSPMIVMSWGAHGFKGNIEERSLTFKVEGRHFKGTVKVALTWLDLYRISFIKPDGTIVKEIDEVYCDQLTPIIDKYVEWIPDYN